MTCAAKRTCILLRAIAHRSFVSNEMGDVKTTMLDMCGPHQVPAPSSNRNSPRCISLWLSNFRAAPTEKSCDGKRTRHLFVSTLCQFKHHIACETDMHMQEKSREGECPELIANLAEMVKSTDTSARAWLTSLVRVSLLRSSRVYFLWA